MDPLDYTEKFELATIQRPPTTAGDKLNYFLNKVLYYWSNYLYVYTTAYHEYDEEDDEGNSFSTAFYIPQLNIWDRKSNWLTVHEEESAQFSALHHAVQWFLDFHYDSAGVVFFNKNDAALVRVLYGLDGDPKCSTDESLIDDVRALKDKGMTIAFAWMPADTRIPGYKSVSKYAVEGIYGDDEDDDDDDD